MDWWLYGLFGLSVFCPVYTYAVYPLLLPLFRRRAGQCGDVTPSVSVVVVGPPDAATRKAEVIRQHPYPRLEVLETHDMTEISSKANCDILLFTDARTRLDPMAVSEIVKPFADCAVAAVVGQQTNPDGNSLFWKYENRVRELESRLGLVSGANDTIFAVRKRALSSVPPYVLNKTFFIAMTITQNGGNIVYQPTAKAYEESTEGTNFKAHVRMAAGYWQALRLFPTMLLPRKGAFVYVSHRVMKWFVWVDMVLALATSGILAWQSYPMAGLFVCQIVVYVMALLFGTTGSGGSIGKLTGLIRYFLELNYTYFLGLFSLQKASRFSS